MIEDNRPGDDGLYTCVVENLLGRLEHSVEVQSVARLVARPPELYRGQPGNHTVVVGSNMTGCRYRDCRPRIRKNKSRTGDPSSASLTDRTDTSSEVGRTRR